MATTQKALELASELINALGRYFTTVSAIQFDSDSNPFFTVTQGTLAAGQQAALVKILPIPNIQLDGLGLAQRTYGQHKAQVLLEATAASARVPLMFGANLVPLLGEVGGRGTEMQVFIGATGAAATTAAALATAVAAANQPESDWWGVDLKFRLMINQ